MISKMNYFTYVPPELIINILSRLPVRTIISCKFVCKLWLKLLNSPDFSKTHLSNAIPGLVVFPSELFKIFEIVDSLDNLESPELHYNPVTQFDRRAFGRLPAAVWLNGSANGLLFLWDTTRHVLYICNPITRDYIQLPSHGGKSYKYPSVVTYGFGVSKMSGQHKLVRIFHDFGTDRKTYLMSIQTFVCQIYTLGTGSWRSLLPGGAPLRYEDRSIAACVNGNLHWLVQDSNFFCLISCFDLQTELFSTFSTPPELHQSNEIFFHGSMVVLRDCLCLCDYTSPVELVIWLMKEYRVEKSWTKEYVISISPNISGGYYGVVYPIKIFKNGDILLAWKARELLYYSNTTGAFSRIDVFERQPGYEIQALPYNPSFLSLKSFTMENASSFYL